MQVFDLKTFRKENNFTQTEAAELFGCKQSYISDIERYRRPMPNAYLDILIARNGEDDVSKYYIEHSQPTVNIENATVGNVMQGNQNKHKGNINISAEQSAENKNKLEQLQKELEQYKKLYTATFDELTKTKGELLKAKDRIIFLQDKLLNNS